MAPATYPQVPAVLCPLRSNALSSPMAQRAVTQPRLKRSGWLSCLFGLAPCGVYRAVAIADTAVGSYPTLSPLPCGRVHEIPAFAQTPTAAGRFAFCCTGRLSALTLKSRTLSGTLPCGVRTFLSRQTLAEARQGGSDHPAACTRSSVATPSSPGERPLLFPFHRRAPRVLG